MKKQERHCKGQEQLFGGSCLKCHWRANGCPKSERKKVQQNLLSDWIDSSSPQGGDGYFSNMVCLFSDEERVEFEIRNHFPDLNFQEVYKMGKESFLREKGDAIRDWGIDWGCVRPPRDFQRIPKAVTALQAISPFYKGIEKDLVEEAKKEVDFLECSKKYLRTEVIPFLTEIFRRRNEWPREFYGRLLKEVWYGERSDWSCLERRGTESFDSRPIFSNSVYMTRNGWGSQNNSSTELWLGEVSLIREERNGIHPNDERTYILGRSVHGEIRKNFLLFLMGLIKANPSKGDYIPDIYVEWLFN